MPAENEIQGFFDKLGAGAEAAYHHVMQDGSVAALGREAVKDVRSTIQEIFFGRGDHGSEPGTPLNPLFSDLAADRQEHTAALESLTATPSPADLAEGKGLPQQQAGTSQLSPADLAEGNGPAAQQHDQQQRHNRGIGM
jgi:hypothetical protein